MTRSQLTLGCGDIFGIWFTPLIWISYAIGLCVKMKDLSWSDDHVAAFIGLSIAWFVIVGIIQYVIAKASTENFDEEPYSWTWFNMPLFVFLLFLLPPYFIALHFFHEDHLMNKSNYILFQSMMPLIIMGILIYPLPKRRNQAANTAVAYLGVLNAFDIMDVISDFEYIRMYKTGWIFWFYLSVIISILLLAFPIGLDEEDDDDPQCGRIFKSLLSLIFTDISFCVLRVIVMEKEDSLSTGLVFTYKNAISALINVFLLMRACFS